MRVLRYAGAASDSAAQTSSTSTATGAVNRPSGGPAASAAGGSGGSAAVAGGSASTLGVGATSQSPDQTSSALGVGASAAGQEGYNVRTRSAVHGNRNLNGQAMASAQDGGTFSRSHTHCKAKAGQSVSCRTKSMAHQPGSKPVMSTSTTDGQAPATPGE